MRTFVEGFRDLALVGDHDTAMRLRGTRWADGLGGRIERLLRADRCGRDLE
jgi:hypothetical protein